MRIYTTEVFPKLSYGSEAWILDERAIAMLNVAMLIAPDSIEISPDAPTDQDLVDIFRRQYVETDRFHVFSFYGVGVLGGYGFGSFSSVGLQLTFPEQSPRCPPLTSKLLDPTLSTSQGDNTCFGNQM